MSNTIMALWCDSPAERATLDTLAAQLPESVSLLRSADRHVTLANLGDPALMDQDACEALASSLTGIAASHTPVLLRMTGLTQFEDHDGTGQGAVVGLLELDGPGMIRDHVCAAATDAGASIDTTFPTFTPHITLGYAPIGVELPDLDMPEPWVCSTLCLAVGPGRTCWQLTGTPHKRRITGVATMTKGTPGSAELKAAPQYTKSIDGRTVVGIFSVFGNRDQYDDIIERGSFNKTIRERGTKILHLWQHDCDEPPIARVESLREIGLNDLPPQLRAQYPDATGGCEVTRTYLDTERANEVFTNLAANIPLQMSFMFDCVKWNSVEDEASAWGYTRYIQEVRLYETSDVNWGANPATIASKRAGAFSVTLESLERALTGYKAGSRHSASDMKLINSMHSALLNLGCDCCAGEIDPETGDVVQAAKIAQSLLTVLERASGPLDDPTLESLAARLVRLAPAIDTKNDPAPLSESRAAESLALTPEQLSWYQRRAALAERALARQARA